MAPDGKTLAIPGEGNTVQLWDVAASQPLGQRARQATLTAVAFSPAGKHLAAAADNGTVRQWDYAAGGSGFLLEAPPARVPFRDGTDSTIPREALPGGHPASLFTLAYSPDGRTLAAAGKDRLIHLWETASGKKRATLAGHTGTIYAVAFAPDGKTFASAGADGQVRLWDLTSKLPGVAGKGRFSDLALEHAWNELQQPDAARAYQAIRVLTAAPEDSLPFLRTRLTPVNAISPKVVELIADLDHPLYARRRQAMLELEKRGEGAQPGLQQALAKNPPLELRRRVEQLLNRLETPALAQQRLRNWRALEVLENLGTPDARQVLQTLARGLPEARLTREAQAVLLRLAQRPRTSS